MGIFSDSFTSIWTRILDNKGKVTSTGGFLLGILLTLTFKDLYPDLEASYLRRLRQLRGKNIPYPPPGHPDFVHLEDHTKDKSHVIADKDDSRRTRDLDGGKIAVGIEGLIGNTPLIKLKFLSDATGCEILAKAELLNGAGNSPKDRVALSMIKLAEEEGLLVPDRGDTIYEGTVGSTGISLAAVCRARGYKAYICMPNDQAAEKSDLLLKLGATVERVKPASIVDQEQFVNLARRRAQEHTDDPDRPGRGFFADQFENTANYMAHQNTTGPEIYAQTNGRVDAFVAGAGTGGTISGVALALKPLMPDMQVILADPQGSGLYNKIKYGVMFSSTEAEGTRRRHQVDSIVEGIGINRVTQNFSAGMELIDDAVKVTDEQAMKMARWLVEKEGLFVGASSAVNCVAAAVTARSMGKGERVVTVLCDSGTRHLSKFWKEAGNIGDADVEYTLDDILGAQT
ncbi:Cysteine synthase 2 [Recurvomyces mirabilis]|uniref:Cysteine synthase 2 n=1 Tax=Recurvomyces mirabilis TaxID=574656 RepID=A0AAE0TPA6_9PEZI|nr:Cysteine synthase 2 [Recurvomyces mirabilis]KAK5155799.1 Cysteine synthase 2 [Recurvomyces mirabilis]